MFTDPYTGKFNLMQGVQQFAPLLLQYMLMQKAFPGQDNQAGAKAQGMASMMPNRPMEQAQPMAAQQGNSLPPSNLDPQTMQILLRLLPMMQSPFRG